MRSSCCGVGPPTRSREAGIELFRTLQFILAVGAELALAAHTGNPFDANTITFFPQIFHIVGDCHDDTSPFVTRDAHGALLHLDAFACIFIVEEASIGATNTAVVDLAKDLAGSGVWDGDGCNFTFGGFTLTFLDAGFLMRWEMHRWYCGEIAVGCSLADEEQPGIALSAMPGRALLGLR